MPRGHSKDEPLTKMLKANGLLLDARSFVGYQGDMTPHLCLKGADVILMRQRVWAKARRKCAECKTEITYSPFADDHGFENAWEMDHIQGGGFRRCDCLHNLRCLCAPCHRKKHVRVKFGGSNERSTS
jgi:hypothetical protein